MRQLARIIPCCPPPASTSQKRIESPKGSEAKIQSPNGSGAQLSFQVVGEWSKATIKNGCILWKSGSEEELKHISPTKFTLLRQEEGQESVTFTAELEQDGTLTWSDGDKWKRAPAEDRQTTSAEFDQEASELAKAQAELETLTQRCARLAERGYRDRLEAEVARLEAEAGTSASRTGFGARPPSVEEPAAATSATRATGSTSHPRAQTPNRAQAARQAPASHDGFAGAAATYTSSASTSLSPAAPNRDRRAEITPPRRGGEITRWQTPPQKMVDLQSQHLLSQVDDLEAILKNFKKACPTSPSPMRERPAVSSPGRERPAVSTAGKATTRHGASCRLYMSGQHTQAAWNACQEWLESGVPAASEIRASTPPFNLPELPSGKVSFPAGCQKINVPVYGGILDEVMTLFDIEDVRACATDLKIRIPEYKIDTFLKGQMPHVREMVEAATARTDCDSKNRKAAQKLKAFADDFEKVKDEDFKSLSDWKKFVETHVPLGWEDRLSFDEVLGNFGFDAAFASALRQQTVEVKHSKDATDQTVTWQHYGVRWVAKSLCGYKPVGCLTDVVNLVFAMMGYSPAEIEAGLSETRIREIIRQFARDEKDRKELWVPTHLVLDCESDDMLGWCLVERMHRRAGTKLSVLAQLPEESQADGIEEFLKGKCKVFRDPDSRNIKAISQYWKPIVSPVIKFMELSAAAENLAAQPRPLVHIKGFASGLLLPDAPRLPPDANTAGVDLAAQRSRTEKAAKVLLAAVKKSGGRTIVWDGDGLAADSFTALIPQLWETDPSLKLVAFLHETRKDKFLASWSDFAKRAGSITVYIVPPYVGSDHTRKYADLGISALRATGSTSVFCFGGGKVLCSEHEIARKELKLQPLFRLVEVGRWVTSDDRKTMGMENSALVGVVEAVAPHTVGLESPPPQAPVPGPLGPPPSRPAVDQVPDPNPKLPLYVDEDTGKYYYHMLGSKSVRHVHGRHFIDGFREEEEGATLRWDGKKDGFEDDKLCRVRREAEDPASDGAREKFLQKEDCTQRFWFEIAGRLGKQLTMDSWASARENLVSRGRRIVKIAGFDGGKPLAGVPWEAVMAELNEKADVIIWDGDWYSDQGWTKLIPEFLRGSTERLAVAFQKRAEVPGFHRQYWHLNKAFPGRVWMVVLDDDIGSLPNEISVQLAWLEEQVHQGKLKRNWVDKYVGVAMMGRKIQGNVPVVAINGGGVAVAQAAIELMKGHVNIPWTVFPGQRVDRTDDPEGTLMGFFQRNPNLRNAKVIDPRLYE